MSYRWLNELSQQFLSKDYLLPNQTLDERVDVVCNAAEKRLNKPGFAKRFKKNFQKGWYSWSTPVWVNFGNDRGLPISCNGSMIEDCMESILYAQAEIGMMTKLGAGTSAYYGKLRGRGADITNNGKSSGSVHFMQLTDSVVNIINQGSARRGNCAVYLPIEHPDIEEFLKIKSDGFPIQKLSYGVTVTDDFMNKMINGDVKKRKLWAKVIEARINTGYPYVVFIDNANKQAPQVYKDKGLEITHSNLCCEIFLYDSARESFVCNLSSLNILYYDEWKDDPTAVEDLAYFLDAVMSEYIEKTENIPYMERAHNFAKNQRALGVGWLGWHSYLQSKMIPFESFEAKQLNIKIAKHINDRLWAASQQMAQEYGEPELLKGYGIRNVTMSAIAPTKSSSFIIEQASEGIEPHKTNYYVKDLAKGKFSIKNTELEKILVQKGKNTDEIWNSILINGGSVQHLDFLSQHEKDVFKTFSEISQKEIIIQAANRQKYIDQGQSINLMIHKNVPVRDINSLMIEAWRMGIKSLYYQLGVSAAQQYYRKEILTCTSCEA